ncbi:MAG: Type 4 prepilin-like protein leader peptide-processing enzyme [Parcubacteria group bacterium GW2011_GWA2_51_10]|nr:MAG: Type 4 prepilin-like protein leader peptide-processing enzyme [Parcubacteria group bacterium GW2011_GWA2_51_10]
MTPALFALFGLIVGSFLNVLILRNGVETLRGRSACLSCGRKIAWYDLVPVVSWIYLRGRCRFCGSRISLQYPLVELLTGILFGLVGLSSLVLFEKLISLPILALLVAIFVYDMKHKIIPDPWVWTFNLLAFLFSLLTTNYLLLTIFSGPITALPLFLLWLVSRGTWMGFGDVKLALGMGWLLGSFYGLYAIFFAFVLGAVISVPLVFFSSQLWKRSIPYHFLHRFITVKSAKGYTMKSEVPFGPFLVSSTIMVWFAMLYNVPLSLLA